jgi:hypothetical protein
MWLSHKGGETSIHVNTTELAPDEACVLFTPNGAELIYGGEADHITSMEMPPPTVRPDFERLLDLKAYYDDRGQYRLGSRRGRLFWQFQYVPAPYGMLRTALTHPELLGQSTELEQLGWAGLLQPPGGVTTFLNPQCVLYCKLPSPNTNEAQFLRLTMPLEATRE